MYLRLYWHGTILIVTYNSQVRLFSTPPQVSCLILWPSCLSAFFVCLFLQRATHSSAIHVIYLVVNLVWLACMCFLELLISLVRCSSYFCNSVILIQPGPLRELGLISYYILFSWVDITWAMRLNGLRTTLSNIQVWHFSYPPLDRLTINSSFDPLPSCRTMIGFTPSCSIHRSKVFGTRA